MTDEAHVMDDAASEPEVLNYDWYGCPHCLGYWNAEALGDRAKVCNLCEQLPAPKLIGHIEKPVNFIASKEANVVKASTEGMAKEGHQYETSALMGAMSGLFDMTTQPRNRRVVLLNKDVKVPSLKKQIFNCIKMGLYAKAATDVDYASDGEVEAQIPRRR